MADSQSPKNKTVRTLGPLVPLGLALLHGALTAPPSPSRTTMANDRAHELASQVGSAVTHHCENISDSQECHTTYPEGCTDTTRPNTYDAYLSYLKNLLPPPNSVQPEATLSSLDDFQSFDKQSIALDIGKQKQAPFAEQLANVGQGNIYEAIGYLYYAIPGGVETCNCKLKNTDDKDFHIGLGFDPEVARSIASGGVNNRGADIDPVVQQTSVIVEMTPYYRSTFHPGWTLTKVQQLEGRRVKVVGQLIIDNEHNTADQNCAFEDHGEECWRGSAWELHPVIALYVCASSQPCTTDSTAWAKFEGQTN